MSSGIITRKRKFQNAQHTVEVVIKAQPKNKSSTKPYLKQGKPFDRECLLKKALEDMQKPCEKGDTKVTSEKMETHDSKHISTSRTKRKEYKKDRHLRGSSPANLTWRDVMEKYSTTSNETSTYYTHSEIINMQHNIDDFHSHHKGSNNIDQVDKRLPIAVSCFPNIKSKSTQTPDPHESKSNSKGLPSSLPNQQYSSKTFTPFGETALKLFKSLREKIYYKVDSETQEIVKNLEAYFFNGGNQNGQNGTPILQSVPSISTNHIPESSDESNRLNMAQQKKIKELEETIRDLKTLSSDILKKYEELKLQTNDRSMETTVSFESRNETSGSEAPPRLEMLVQHLTAERDSLLREVTKQRDIILQLEIKLNQQNRESTNRQGHTQESRNSNHLISARSPIQPPSRMETDSAFTERTSGSLKSPGEPLSAKQAESTDRVSPDYPSRRYEGEPVDVGQHKDEEYNNNILKALGRISPCYPPLSTSISIPSVSISDVSDRVE